MFKQSNVLSIQYDYKPQVLILIYLSPKYPKIDIWATIQQAQDCSPVTNSFHIGPIDNHDPTHHLDPCDPTSDLKVINSLAITR